MSDETTIPPGGIAVEPEALKALQFYDHNYSVLFSAALGAGSKRIVLGTKPFQCRFCGGTEPQKTFKKRAHAVSELLGNKIIVSLYECDDCNKRFAGFEDDLAKMTLPFRSIGGVMGKGGIPTLLSARSGNEREARIKLKGGTLEISHDAGHSAVVEDELAKTLTFNYVEQPYRPLGAYKALCKSAFTLLPRDELANFEDLRQWLLQKDLSGIYCDGSHICYRTFVPAFRPFPQPIVRLLKRNAPVDAGYMSFFIAFGNVSYQIFLPCPAKDEYLRGKTISTPPWPHLYQLQPWLIPTPTIGAQIDLSSAERTKKRTGSTSWRYERKVKVE
jgi:hypothetical protein